MGFYGIYSLVSVDITIEHHHSQWENSLFLWPCLIAMVTRGSYFAMDVDVDIYWLVVWNIFYCSTSWE